MNNEHAMYSAEYELIVCAISTLQNQTIENLLHGNWIVLGQSAPIFWGVVDMGVFQLKLE